MSEPAAPGDTDATVCCRASPSSELKLAPTDDLDAIDHGDGQDRSPAAALIARTRDRYGCCLPIRMIAGNRCR
jgi:hypothetical protein